MYCEKCGKQISDTAKFCAGCGSQTTTPQTNMVFKPQRIGNKSKKRHSNCMIMLLLLIIPIILVSAISMYFNTKSQYVSFDEAMNSEGKQLSVMGELVKDSEISYIAETGAYEFLISDSAGKQMRIRTLKALPKHFDKATEVVVKGSYEERVFIAADVLPHLPPLYDSTIEDNEPKEKPPIEVGSQWSYSESEDKMGRGKVKTASTHSINMIEFDFPYQGAQRATLQLRIHPEWGNNVILSIERGQFLCDYDECSVNVRFDQGTADKYDVGEPADHSTTTLFIKNYDKFISNLRKSNKVYIEARFYQEGNHVFEFDVSGLKW